MNDPRQRVGVVILDRDGTLVIDRGYLADPRGLEFAPFAREGIKTLYDSGFRLVVASNQSGIGRGFFSRERMLAMNARLHDMVRDAGAQLEAIYFCPHAPEAGCDCRKPALGLMRQAASDLKFDPARAVVIGDKTSDVEFGLRAGASTILISTGAGATYSASPADVIVADFGAAARAVLSITSARTSN